MYKLHLVIQGNPKSLNQTIRSNHFRNYTEKKKWEQIVCYLCKGKEPTRPLVKYNLKITRHASRMMDFDGLVGSLKPLIDGLILAGIIKDDGWQNSGPWEIDQIFRSRKEGPQIEIFVRESAI